MNLLEMNQIYAMLEEQSEYIKFLFENDSKHEDINTILHNLHKNGEVTIDFIVLRKITLHIKLTYDEYIIAINMLTYLQCLNLIDYLVLLKYNHKLRIESSDEMEYNNIMYTKIDKLTTLTKIDGKYVHHNLLDDMNEGQLKEFMKRQETKKLTNDIRLQLDKMDLDYHCDYSIMIKYNCMYTFLNYMKHVEWTYSKIHEIVEVICYCGTFEFLKIMLQNKHVNRLKNIFNGGIKNSIKNPDLRIVNYFIDNGYEICDKYHFVKACKVNNIKLLEKLIKKWSYKNNKKCINMCFFDDDFIEDIFVCGIEEAFKYSVEGNNIEFIKFLLKYNPTIKMNHFENIKSVELFELLLDNYGYSNFRPTYDFIYNLCTFDKHEILDFVHTNYPHFNYQHVNFFIEVYRCKNYKIIKLLLSYGFDLNDYLRVYSFPVDLELATIFLKHGVSNYIIKRVFRSVYWSNNLELIELLCEYGANYNEIFIYSCKNNDLNEINKLIEIGVDINVQKGRVFITACKYSSLDLIEILISNGADIHTFDDQAIKMAIKRNNIAVIELLKYYM